MFPDRLLGLTMRPTLNLWACPELISFEGALSL